MVRQRTTQLQIPTWIVTTIALLTIWTIVSLGTYRAWIKGADHRDFYPLWAGARSVLEGRKDLYSLETTRLNQIRLYGSVIPEGRDQQAFAYPAYTLPFLLPFALITDVELATAIWEGLTVVLLICGLTLVQKAMNARSSPLATILLIIWSYSTLMIFQGQITGLIIFAVGTAYWAVKVERDFIGGLIISISIVKAELAILPILVLAFYAIRERRLRYFLGLMVGGLALLLFSFLLIGNWVGDWIAAITRYTEYAQSVWPPGFLWELSPILLVALLFVIVMSVFKVRMDDEHLFAAALTTQFMLLPQTLIWGLSTLTLPLAMVWKWGRRAGVVGVWALGWVLFLLPLGPEWWKYQVILISLATLLLVYWGARKKLSPNRVTSRDS